MKNLHVRLRKQKNYDAYHLYLSVFLYHKKIIRVLLWLMFLFFLGLGIIYNYPSQLFTIFFGWTSPKIDFAIRILLVLGCTFFGNRVLPFERLRNSALFPLLFGVLFSVLMMKDWLGGLAEGDISHNNIVWTLFYTHFSFLFSLVLSLILGVWHLQRKTCKIP